MVKEIKKVSETEMTTRELAEQLGTDKKVIIENARKYLPNKVFEHGKPTFWNKAEVTLLIDGMKGNNSNQHREKGTVTGAVTVASTDLTPALKIKKAMELMQEGYEEELAILRAKNAEQKRQLEEQQPKVEFYDRTMSSDGTYSMAETAKILKLGYGNVTLFKKLKSMELLDKNNVALQEYVNRGYFVVVTKPVVIGDSTVNKTVTRVTSKGMEYIANKLSVCAA